MAQINLGLWEPVFDSGIWTLYGKSTYSKPNPTRNDDMLGGKVIFIYQVDNQKVFKYDYETSTWIEQ